MHSAEACQCAQEGKQAAEAGAHAVLLKARLLREQAAQEHDADEVRLLPAARCAASLLHASYELMLCLLTAMVVCCLQGLGLLWGSACRCLTRA